VPVFKSGSTFRIQNDVTSLGTCAFAEVKREGRKEGRKEGKQEEG
jgi:hypothetical protein